MTEKPKSKPKNQFESHDQSQMRAVGEVHGDAYLGDQITTYESHGQKEAAVLAVGAHPPRFEKYWVDRLGYQTTLIDRLARESVVEIVAAGGFGKSSLAAWAYAELAKEFQNSLWIDFRNGRGFNDVARWLLQEIGFLVRDPAATDEALLRELLYRLQGLKQPVLVVLDQLEAIAHSPDRPWFEQFLAGWARDGQRSRVLVTTRLSVLAQEPIALGGLTIEEGARFFEREGIAGDSGALVRLTAGHPLLLKLAATWTKQTYGGRLDGQAIDFFGKLFAQYQGDPEAGVEAIFGEVFEALSAGWRDLLLRVAVYREPFGEAMAQAMRPETTAAELRILADRGLLIGEGDRVSLHPLVAELVVARVPQEIREQAHEQAIVYYSAHFQPWDGTIESCQAELEGFYHCCELGQYGRAYGLLNRCFTQLDRAGYWRDLRGLYEQLTTTWHPEDDEATQNLGWAWTRLGVLQRRLGDVAFSIDSHHQAQALFDRLDFAEGKAAALGNLGNAYDSLGDYQRAIDLHFQSLEINQEIGDKCGVATSLGNLGSAYCSLGDYQRAIDFLSQCLEVMQAIGDKAGVASSLCNLGNAYFSPGDYQQAIEFHSQCMEVMQEIGDKGGVAASLGNLGNAYDALGDYQRAIDFHSQSLELAQAIGDKGCVANSLSSLGIVYRSLGDYQRAIEFHSQHREVAQEIGDKGGVAASLCNLGSAYCSLGDYQPAIDFYSQSLELAQAIGDKGDVAASLGNLGSAYCSLGDYQRAIDFYSQSLELAQAIGDKGCVANSLGNLGIAYWFLGDYQRAIDFHSQSLRIKQAIGDKRGVATSLGNLGNAYNSLGDYQRAIDFYSQQRELAQAIGDRWGEGASYFNLALAQAKLDNHWAAKQNLEQAKAIYTALKLDHLVETCDQAIRERNQIIAATPIKAPTLEEPEALPDWYLKSLPANEPKPRPASSSKTPLWLWFAVGIGIVLLIAWLR